jgi:UDP-N-acetylmuramoylalanine--D-glutamate ligase
MAARNHFKGKRIAMVGLGSHGEMLEDAKYLIKSGALLSVYDLRSEARLKSNIVFLRSLGLANYVCSGIPPDDLLDMDLIILSHDYPRDSTFLDKVREKGIPIEYPETLFFKLAPPITIVGVIGLYGKSTVMSILSPMLDMISTSLEDRTNESQGFFVSDPETDNGILCHLKSMKNGDILLLRMTILLMQELHEVRMSPQVAVFTTMPTKNEYKDSPFETLEFQTYNNFIIASDEIIDATRSFNAKPRAKMLRTKANIIPAEWDFQGRPHDRMWAALALQTARLFKVSDDDAQRILENWKPLKGRIEFIKKLRGNVEFYNDTGSVSPNATIRALTTLSENRNIVLVIGGAKSTHDYSELYKVIPQYAHTLIVLPGSGTIHERRKIHSLVNIEVFSAPSIEEAVRVAKERAHSGDRIVFSPAFPPGGMDASRKERGERFVRAVRGL